MFNTFQNLLAVVASTALLCILWAFGTWKHLRGIHFRPSTNNNIEIERQDVRTGEHGIRVEKAPLEEGSPFFPFLNPLGPLDAERACLEGNLPCKVTSGHLAAMVKSRHEDKDERPNSMYQSSHPWTSQAGIPSLSTWPNDMCEDANKIEHDSIEFYYDPNVPSIWRRRLLAFVGR